MRKRTRQSCVVARAAARGRKRFAMHAPRGLFLFSARAAARASYSSRLARRRAGCEPGASEGDYGAAGPHEEQCVLDRARPWSEIPKFSSQ